jgi:hypothetical protein
MLATSMINKTHKIVSIEGLSGFIELGMLQSAVGKSFRFVMASGFANWLTGVTAYIHGHAMVCTSAV